jgi:hypothetical protein
MKTSLSFRVPGRMFFCAAIFFTFNTSLFSQNEKSDLATFGLRPAFNFPEYHLLSYPVFGDTDSWTHTYRFPASRVPGTLTSVLAYSMYSGYFDNSQSTVMQRKELNEKEREALFRLNQQVWNTYYHDWKKQSKAQLYQVDLEGIVRGVMSKPMW